MENFTSSEEKNKRRHLKKKKKKKKKAFFGSKNSLGRLVWFAQNVFWLSSPHGTHAAQPGCAVGFTFLVFGNLFFF